MKILHVLAQKPSRTGSGVYYSNVIEELEEKGHEQRGIFAYQQVNDFQSLEESHQYPVEFESQEIPFPIPGMSDVMPYKNTVYSDMDEEMIAVWTEGFRRTLLQVKEEFSPDVIISHHLWMLTSLVVEIFPQAYIVGICHNTDIRQALQNPDLKKKYTGNLQNLDKVYTLSDFQIPEIHRSFQIPVEKIATLGGGFHEKYFYPLPSKEKKDASSTIRLVFCGKIDASKGIYQLVEVFHSLAEKHPTLILDIIGAPQDENILLLERAVDSHPRIICHPPAPQKELGEMLRTKDIFVMPSFFEGMGLLALESLASGLWAVATEIPGLMSLLGEELCSSGVIEFVPLPRIVDIDKAVEEDLPQFQRDLYRQIEKQITRVQQGDIIPLKYRALIQKHSWKELVEGLHRDLEKAISLKTLLPK